MQVARAKVIPLVIEQTDDATTKPHRVNRSANSATDCFWADIAGQLNNIFHVAAGMRGQFSMSAAAAEACEVMQNMVNNCRFLQEEQRQKPYDPIRDDAIATIAEEYITAALNRVEWPRNSVLWRESIELSAIRIAQKARQRQAANGGASANKT